MGPVRRHHVVHKCDMDGTEARGHADAIQGKGNGKGKGVSKGTSKVTSRGKGTGEGKRSHILASSSRKWQMAWQTVCWLDRQTGRQLGEGWGVGRAGTLISRPRDGAKT
eukprot:4113658-Alexandrium_andersonii.AAC.2